MCVHAKAGGTVGRACVASPLDFLTAVNVIKDTPHAPEAGADKKSVSTVGEKEIRPFEVGLGVKSIHADGGAC